MSIKIILGYIFGYLNIVVEGYYIERFINICKNNKILIWNLKRDKEIRLKLKVGIHDFRKICEIAKKTKCKVKIKSKKGIPFLLNRYKKRKIFLIFLLILVMIMFLSSNFVWNVEIRVEDDRKIENIMEDIESAGLKIGELKSSINTKNIISQIRLKREDIAWIGIELKGTNAIVKLSKAEKKPDIIDELDYCSIVSNKTGVITKIKAQNGSINVKVGDTVKEGDVLINGWMEGKYTGIRYVHAKGEIEAKVWYSKSKIVEYKTTQRQETGDLENKYTLKFNNFEINLHKKLSKFEIYDTIDEESKFKLFSDFYLPISIKKTTNKEVKEVEKHYEMEEAKNLGIEELQKELDNEIDNKESIVGKNINTYEKENGIEIVVTYEVLENIGTNEKIVF